MPVSQAKIQEMFKAIPDPKMRQQLSSIMTSKEVKAIHCTSEDTIIEVDEPILDKNNQPTYGKDGTPKTKLVKQTTQVGCKGRVIAYVLDNGQVSPVTGKDGETYLRAWRSRLDGHLGFECWCGNDSRLSAQEKGHIGANAPSKTDLERVWENVSKKPSNYPVIKGEQNIDGFVIKEIA